MGYKVVLKPSAVKELAKLDRPVQQRIAEFIEEIKTSENPRFSGIALQGACKLWRYRVGDYRVIAEIEDNVITVIIFKIGHRSEVYK